MRNFALSRVRKQVKRAEIVCAALAGICIVTGIIQYVRDGGYVFLLMFFALFASLSVSFSAIKLLAYAIGKES